VTNRRKIRNSFHGLSYGFGAIVCALACGAGDKEAGNPLDARGGNAALQPARDAKGTSPAGDQLSPACDDSPLSTPCTDPVNQAASGTDGASKLVSLNSMTSPLLQLAPSGDRT
jgi:hypothetical protein